MPASSAVIWPLIFSFNTDTGGMCTGGQEWEVLQSGGCDQCYQGDAVLCHHQTENF